MSVTSFAPPRLACPWYGAGSIRTMDRLHGAIAAAVTPLKEGGSSRAHMKTQLEVTLDAKCQTSADYETSSNSWHLTGGIIYQLKRQTRT